MASPAVFAQLYKWVDADGGVNYGDSPPSDARNVKAVGPVSLSVVPGVPKEQMDAMRERDEQRRMVQLQRDEQRRMVQLQRDELEDARARAKANASPSPWPSDEDQVAYDYGYYPVYGYGPPRGRPPYRHRPRPAPRTEPSLLPTEPLPLGQSSILKGR